MRRGRGDGSWTALADGRWRYQFSLGVVGGRRVRKSVTARTKREAQQLASAIRSESAPLPRGKLAPYLDRWLLARTPYLKPATLHQYGWATGIVKARLGTLNLPALSRQDVEAMLTTLPMLPTSANAVRVVLVAALRDAERDGLVTTNVARHARPLPTRKRETATLTGNQVETLLAHLRGSRAYGPVLLAVRLGMRQGEILGLGFDDVGTALTVRHTLREEPGGVFERGTPKTQASARVLPLTDEVREVVKVERDRQRFKGKGWDHRFDGWQLVFRTDTGRPISASHLRQQFKSALRETSLPDVRFHDLRHTAASLMLSAGVDMSIVKELLGHANIGTTINTYGHPSLDAKLSALNRIGTPAAN